MKILINKYESNNKKNFEFNIKESSVHNFLETIKSFVKSVLYLNNHLKNVQ